MRTFIFIWPFNPVNPGRAALGLCLVAVLLIHGGCAVGRPAAEEVSDASASPEHGEGEESPVDSADSDAGAYLDMFVEFNAADAARREALYERASVAAALEASPHRRLRLALLKLSPGHRGHNPRAAETLLRSVIEDPGELPEGAVKLAVVNLKLIEAYNRVKSDNAKLERQLQEARSKLEAVKQIERSVDPPGDETLEHTDDDEQDNE